MTQQEAHTLPLVDLEALERQLTILLYTVWKAQGKRRKIITLPQVDNKPGSVVILQQMTGDVGIESDSRAGIPPLIA